MCWSGESLAPTAASRQPRRTASAAAASVSPVVPEADTAIISIDGQGDPDALAASDPARIALHRRRLVEQVPDLFERYELSETYAAICFVILVSVLFFVLTEWIERWLRPAQ